MERPTLSRKKRSFFSSRGASRGARGAAGGFAQANVAGGRHSRKELGGFRGGSRSYDYATYEREPATPEYLRRLFAQHDFPVADREAELFWKYYCLLRDRNAELDLTRIMGIEATVLKHFIDSAIVLDLVPVRGPLLDIGSGPGFPGAPIAIRRPDLAVILAESRGKRVGFLEEAKRTLQLANVTIYPRSVREDSPFVAAGDSVGESDGQAVVESEAVHSTLNTQHSTLAIHDVVSRALEAIPATLQRVLPFMPAGGQVIFMKGPNCGQEVTDAQERFKGIYKMTHDIKYELPKSRDQRRRLVVFERRPIE
jgi:16S rRNA G527 N7-methylase RsmG